MTLRPARNNKAGSWEVDIRFEWPDGSVCRERKNSPVEGKRASARWARQREFFLQTSGKPAFLAQRALPDPLPWPASGGVYFVHCVGRIKIGRAACISERLQALQTSAPAPLELVAVAVGAVEQEKDYHFRFQHLRVTGEWFTIADDLLAEIRTLRALGQ